MFYLTDVGSVLLKNILLISTNASKWIKNQRINFITDVKKSKRMIQYLW